MARPLELYNVENFESYDQLGGVCEMKIQVDNKVDIKAGSHKGKSGIVTMIAIINNKKRYYVKRENGTMAWYYYHQIRLAKSV